MRAKSLISGGYFECAAQCGTPTAEVVHSHSDPGTGFNVNPRSHSAPGTGPR
jgi:hypothetical protein